MILLLAWIPVVVLASLLLPLNLSGTGVASASSLADQALAPTTFSYLSVRPPT